VANPSAAALRYHDATKHHFHRFARSTGYLDWATQPDPFRRYAGAPIIELPRSTAAPATAYTDLYVDGAVTAAPIDETSIGTFLRYSMGLSAWKQYGASRWALRVNPSSGNLHPTEAYVVWQDRVLHYAAREHALEERCLLQLKPEATTEPAFLVGLTSIHWREAWKYGERAFRYCQHDAGHAVAALRLSAAMLGWRLALLPDWSDAAIASLLGLDRDSDFGEAEREEGECIAVVTAGDPAPWMARDPAPLVTAARSGAWQGHANTLSAGHVEWTAIEDVARATRRGGAMVRGDEGARVRAFDGAMPSAPAHLRTPAPSHPSAAEIILRRRSALGFDPRGVLRRDVFLTMLARLRPGAPPWDAIDWPPQLHLALFVHRVQDMTPGIYVYLRDAKAVAELKAAMRPEFLWEQVADSLFLLVPIDVQRMANRLSCDQDIAADGFFSLGMIARVEDNLRDRGEWFYRQLFWESGLIGQVLYLEAEAAGARATGIGCFYDDPVHEVLGLSGHAWQSLYHFSMGLPVDDGRLTTEPGYAWEASGSGLQATGVRSPQPEG
jgi:SagB-type dehydrogenase family enzyme